MISSRKPCILGVGRSSGLRSTGAEMETSTRAGCTPRRNVEREREGGAHGEVGGALPLVAGDGVEDDGGEVGDEVRRLAAQRRQVPHPSATRARPCGAV